VVNITVFQTYGLAPMHSNMGGVLGITAAVSSRQLQHLLALTQMTEPHGRSADTILWK
jgi:hypothetical protein